ncbi:MAG: formate dehydrogenase accessory protein FdhE [Thermodesulfovibrionales bacterium]
MTLVSLAGERPYLEDVAALYEKVLEFDRVGLRHDYCGVAETPRHYVAEDIDGVVGEFARIFALSEETAQSLRESIRSGALDFTRLVEEGSPLEGGLMPGGEEEEEQVVSFLYIISRPYFRAIRKCVDADGIYWEEGRCPVCNSRPALSILDKNDARRYFCSFCGTVGPYKRIGCPLCGNEKAEKIDIIYSEDDRAARIDACQACMGYVKTVEAAQLSENTMEELDLISLPFDIIAQGRGFSRKAPNPVGMRRIR